MTRKATLWPGPVLRANPRFRQPCRPISALRRTAQDPGHEAAGRQLRGEHLPGDPRAAPRPSGQLGPWKAWRDSPSERGLSRRPGLPPSLIALDPPEHDRIRLLLSRQSSSSTTHAGLLRNPEMANIVAASSTVSAVRTRSTSCRTSRTPSRSWYLSAPCGPPRRRSAVPRVVEGSTHKRTCSRRAWPLPG